MRSLLCRTQQGCAQNTTNQAYQTKTLHYANHLRNNISKCAQQSHLVNRSKKPCFFFKISKCSLNTIDPSWSIVYRSIMRTPLIMCSCTRVSPGSSSILHTDMKPYLMQFNNFCLCDAKNLSPSSTLRL